MWMDRRNDKGESINIIRIKSLQATGAQTTAVACPHCLTMLNSAQSSLGDKAQASEILDIAEIVARQLVTTRMSDNQFDDAEDPNGDVTADN